MKIKCIRRNVIIGIIAGMMVSCSTNNTDDNNSVIAENNNVMPSNTLEETNYSESRNDIRFAGWTDKEWVNNEYICTVRKYIDKYLNGEIGESNFDENKDYIKGKFLVISIKPSLFGGVFMHIIFFDNPKNVFSVLVRSDVDEDTGIVSNYECMGLKLEMSDADITQEIILEFLEEYPNHKLW